MADQAITALPKKTYSGSSQIASTDYLLGIDSAEGYQMLIQDLGEYIINRATASLAGSTQTLASAISALNSNKNNFSGTIKDTRLPSTNQQIENVLIGTSRNIMYLGNGDTVDDVIVQTKSGNVSVPDLNSKTYSLTGGTALTANTNLNTITTPGNYVSASASVSGSLVNSPVTNMGFSLKVENVNNELAILQRITTRGATVQVYERTATLGGGTTTWDGEWKLVPTRAEMDALNSNLSNLYCREYSYATGTSYKDAVTDVISKLGDTIARYWVIITIGTSRHSLMIIKDGTPWSNGILTTYGSGARDVYFVVSRSGQSGETVVYLRKLLTGDLEE